MKPPPPRSTPFPYTTLFRSRARPKRWRRLALGRGSRPCQANQSAAERQPDVIQSPDASKAPKARVATASSRSSWVARSEEHTSELQSRLHLVCRLLLEKKNQ